MTGRWARWLRAYFVFGAVVDGLAVIALLSPTLTEMMLGLEADSGRPDVRFLAGYAATLMAGWTALLAWAAADPVRRAFVGPMTAVPVLAGLMATETAALGGGDVDPVRVVPLLAVQLAWCVLWFLLYYAVRREGLLAAARG